MPAHSRRKGSPIPDLTPLGRLPLLFALLAGLFLATVIIYSGNPVPLEDAAGGALPMADTGSRVPGKARYWLLLVVTLAGLTLAHRPKTVPKALLFLPLFWLAWQLLSAATTVDWTLTKSTLAHFTAVVVCFALGLLTAPATVRPHPLWAGIILGLCVVSWAGWTQRFGGLEQTRLFYEKLYRGEQPPEIQSKFNTEEFRRVFMTPAFQLKIASKRIFATFVYPNALASAVLLLFPPAVVALWQMLRQLPFVCRGTLVGTFLILGLGCLYWSASKSAWLIGLALAAVIFTRIPMPRSLKAAVLAGFVGLGLLAFALKFQNYFSQGAKSASARMSYWRAALLTVRAHPILGTGPGTFSRAYAAVKRPDEEMARLTHNDYLEQASDSGIPGFLAYLGWISGALCFLYRKRNRTDALSEAGFLGLAAWAVHCFVEFGLYIPGLSWPAFFLFGHLMGKAEG